MECVVSAAVQVPLTRLVYGTERWLFRIPEINWASEASPTLDCSIEISRDIYICL